MRKSIRMIFTISIILNMIFIGVVAGILYNRWSDFSDRYATKELSPQAQNIVAKTFQGSRADIRKHIQESRQIRKDLYTAITAETFDVQVFDEAAQRLQNLQGDIQSHKIELVKKMAAELSQEDRQKMARRLISSLDGRRMKDGRSHRSKRFQDQKEPDHRPAPME